MAVPDKCKLHQVAVNHAGNGLQHNQSTLESSFLSGIKQRLLSFIFSGIWTEETDQTLVCHVADNPCFFKLVGAFLPDGMHCLCNLCSSH